MHQSSRKRNPLTLSAGQHQSLLADFRVNSIVKFGNEIIRLGKAQRLPDVIIAELGIPERNIRLDRSVVQYEFLRHISDQASPLLQIDFRSKACHQQE